VKKTDNKKRRTLYRGSKGCGLKGKPIRVCIGKSYKDAVIAKKKPKNSVKIGETKSFIRYVLGAKVYLLARKGYVLVK